MGCLMGLEILWAFRGPYLDNFISWTDTLETVTLKQYLLKYTLHLFSMDQVLSHPIRPSFPLTVTVL